MKYVVQLINNPLIEIKLTNQAVHSTLETVTTVYMYSRATGESRKKKRKKGKKGRIDLLQDSHLCRIEHELCTARVNILCEDSKSRTHSRAN
jgi:hypothetical protein